MTFVDPDSEGALEANTIRLFESLGWQFANCYHEICGENPTLGRETTEQVVLEWKLKAALEKLNPDVPPLALDLALDELTKDRSILSPVRANQEVQEQLKDGIKVTFRTSDDNEAVETVKIIDWEHPANNDFFLASQFWISGEYGRKRADLVGFVNGIPLLFIELKASHKHLENAYNLNLSDYRSTIPQVFWYNGVIILSNGSKSRIGSITAGWEHFADPIQYRERLFGAQADCLVIRDRRCTHPLHRIRFLSSWDHSELLSVAIDRRHHVPEFGSQPFGHSVDPLLNFQWLDVLGYVLRPVA